MAALNSGRFKKGGKPLVSFPKGHTPWNKGLKGFRTGSRPDMKGVLVGPKNPFYGKKHTTETRLKMSELKRGDKSPNWIPDRSRLKKDERAAYDYAAHVWRKEVKCRDGRKCQIGNEDCSGVIEAHHILPWRDFPKLRYTLSNGISLCFAHHPRRHEDEKRLVSFYQSILGNTYGPR